MHSHQIFQLSNRLVKKAIAAMLLLATEKLTVTVCKFLVNANFGVLTKYMIRTPNIKHFH